MSKQIIAEYCPSCCTEVEIVWDIKKDGYKAFCPYCGDRLMLCDMCLHDEDDKYTGDCDYCAETDKCKHNR